MSPQTIYLVTGASRGISLALVVNLSSNPDNVVYAGVRDTGLAVDHPLCQLVKNGSNVNLIKITSANKEDNYAAAEIVKQKYGKVDVIIANAASNSGVQPIITITTETIHDNFTINAIGPLILFQAFAALLDKSDSAKFIVVSSTIGQISECLPYAYNGYGLSKAAVNFISKRIDQEVKGVISFPIHPGTVTTDMGRASAAAMGARLEDFGPISPEASAAGILAIVAAASKETHGGKFWSYDGSVLAY